jgi:hypothetical protein
MPRRPRNRIVVFRLTQDEYLKLKQASEKRGAPNLSDFTRSEVLAFLHSGTLPGHVHFRLAALEQGIGSLQTAVNRISHLLEGVAHVGHAS